MTAGSLGLKCEVGVHALVKDWEPLCLKLASGPGPTLTVKLPGVSPFH